MEKATTFLREKGLNYGYRLRANNFDGVLLDLLREFNEYQGIQQLESRIKELEGTIENNVTELITVTEEVYSGCFSEITKTKCCGIAPITNENFCPNCGRKIVR